MKERLPHDLEEMQKEYSDLKRRLADTAQFRVKQMQVVVNNLNWMHELALELNDQEVIDRVSRLREDCAEMLTMLKRHQVEHEERLS